MDANVFYQPSFRAQSLSCSTLSSPVFAWSLVRLITKYAASRTYMKLCAPGHPASARPSIYRPVNRPRRQFLRCAIWRSDRGRQRTVGNNVPKDATIATSAIGTYLAVRVIMRQGISGEGDDWERVSAEPVACEWIDLAWRIAQDGASSQGGQVQRLFALRECLNLVSLVVNRSEACRPHDLDGIGCGLFLLAGYSGACTVRSTGTSIGHRGGK